MQGGCCSWLRPVQAVVSAPVHHKRLFFLESTQEAQAGPHELGDDAAVKAVPGNESQPVASCPAPHRLPCDRQPLWAHHDRSPSQEAQLGPKQPKTTTVYKPSLVSDSFPCPVQHCN